MMAIVRSLLVGPLQTLAAGIAYALPARYNHIMVNGTVTVSIDNSNYATTTPDSNGMLHTSGAFIKSAAGATVIIT